jgi:uncharacterized protein (TIGR03435 family)
VTRHAAAIAMTVLLAGIGLIASQGGTLAFEVASIQPNTSGDARKGLGPSPGGGFAATNVTLKELIPYAYGLPQLAASSRIFGGPKWIDTDRFDLVAKTAEPATPQQLGQMLRALLADRFKLSAHHDTRSMPVFALVQANKDRRPGPQLRTSPYQDDYCNERRAVARLRSTTTAPGPPCGSGRSSPGHIVGTSWTLEQLANVLAQFAGRLVRDETGMPGRFDLELEWAPDTRAAAPSDERDSPAIDPNAPPLVTALREQLGLKLESRTAPVDVVVIDSAERLTPD